MKRARLLLASLCTAALTAGAGVAHAQPGRGGLGLGAFEALAPPRPLGRTPVGRVLAGAARLADEQRSGAAAPRATPPWNTSSAAIPWLPDVRVGLPPPGEDVVAGPNRPVGVGIVIQTTNMQVAGATGNPGLLLGGQITGPWMIP